MTSTFSIGDHVEWNTPQGKTRGKIEKKLTRRTQIEGHDVAASPDDPQYLVRSEKTGKRAVHKPAALKKGKDQGPVTAEIMK
ncbi:MAG: DUF2945 domain-containing protein [Gammaproteobacteria bacterium]